MSVDTYLKGKNTSRYRKLRRDGLEVMVAPILNAQAALIELDVRRFLLFWRKLAIDVRPRGDHFHAPT